MTLDLGVFTDKQWWAMCDVHLSLPVPLGTADKMRPFVYDRKWGLFHCPPGFHQSAMGLLLAFHHGETCRLALADRLRLDVPYGLADHYLEHTPGTAFRSSVGAKLTSAWSAASLTAFERRMLGPLQYLAA